MIVIANMGWDSIDSIGTSKPSKKGKKTVLGNWSFAQKTFQMVCVGAANQNTSHQHTIAWSEAGDSFVVIDGFRLSDEVLPVYFSHGNLSTFVRQLNFYGFRKDPKDAKRENGSSEEYRHEYFKRNHPELLSLISRKKTTDAGQQRRKDSMSTSRDGEISSLEFSPRCSGQSEVGLVCGLQFRSGSDRQTGFSGLQMKESMKNTAKLIKIFSDLSSEGRDSLRDTMRLAKEQLGGMR